MVKIFNRKKISILVILSVLLISMVFSVVRADDDEDDDDDEKESSSSSSGKAQTTVNTDVKTSTKTEILKDSDGDGTLDIDDPHPNMAEIYIVEDANNNGIVDKFESDNQK